MKFIFHLLNINEENNVFTPSILEIHKVGGIFIFFHARFVHSIRMDKVRLGKPCVSL
ncbi:MAG: hypothetical protein U9R01_07115 [candidate division WOR-3 bacterium]|nr:hypothetical protein [candidate division WOR-3 bacterium]